MNAIIDFLANRVSIPRLQEPAPSAEELDSLFAASLRVPDHLQLRPWRFLQIRDEGLNALGQLFADAEKHNKPEASDEALLQKASKALRAPLIIIGICSHQAHDKVPELEQQISTGCVLHNLGLGLRSMGYASVWRTGGFAFDPFIMKGLGLTENESIAGYLYVGTAASEEKALKPIEVKDHLQTWPG